MSDHLETAINRYGQAKAPTETPELLNTKLGELQKELAKIPESKKGQYLKALEVCPEQCDEKFMLKHLRCEVFNVEPAAKRVIAYWEKRVGIFGDEKAFLPMTLLGALKGDERSLEIGYARPVFEKDDAGRAIIFIDPARLPMDKTTFEPISMARAFWYYAHAVLEDEEVQKKGVVLLIYPKEAQRTQFNRKVFKAKIASMKGCLPMRMAAFHICHPPSFFENLFAVAKIFLGGRLRKRVKMHSGSEEGVLDKLEKKFGIDRVKMPTQMGGGNDLDHMAWLEERMSSGL